MLKRRRTEQDELLPGAAAAPVSPSTARPATVRQAPVAPPLPPEPEPEEIAGPLLPDRPDRPRKRRRPRTVFLLIRPLALMAGFVVLVYLCVPLVLRVDRLRPVVEDVIGQTMGRHVRVGSLKFTPALGGLIASDVTVAEDPAFGSGSFIHAQQVALDVNRMPLLFGGRVEIEAVDVSEPSITLRRNASGRWNYASVLSAGAAPQGAGLPIRLRNAIVTIRREENGEPVTLRKLNADFPRFATGSEMTFGISAAVDGGGTVKLNGKAGPVFWASGSPRIPISMLVNARKVALAGSNLIQEIAPAFDGLLTFDGTVEADGNALTASGNARLENLKLAKLGTPSTDPLLLVMALRHNLNNNSGEISRCEIHLGKGSAEMQGSYAEVGGRPALHFSIEARGIPAPPLASLVNAAAIPLPSGTSLQGGVAFLALGIEGSIDHPVTTGSLTVDNARLVGFDPAERLSPIAGLDGLRTGRDLEINTLTAKVNAGPERVALDDIDADLAGIAKITGSGAILDDRTLDFRLDAVRTGINDRRPIPFVVRGACSAPLFRQPGKAN
jgi:AsmA protein